MTPHCVLITWADGTHATHGPFRSYHHAAAYAEDILEGWGETKTKAEVKQLLEPI